MVETSASEVTRWLHAWRGGDRQALDQLIPSIYRELHRLAQSSMRGEAAGATLQPTALVNEAFVRLVEMDVPWQDRAHFFAIAAGLMRRIIIDQARRRRALRRGGPQRPATLGDVASAVPELADLLDLDEALGRLEQIDERKHRVVELRLFAGLTIAETAEVLELSHATVERDLKMARAWLAAELSGG